MRKKIFWWLVVAAGTTLASISAILGQAGGQTPLYLDPKRPVEERIDDLMSRMTLKEKVGQLNLSHGALDRYGIRAYHDDEPGRESRRKMETYKKFIAGTYS